MTPALEILTLFVIIKSRSVLLCGVTRVGSSMSCFSESEKQRSLILDDSAYLLIMLQLKSPQMKTSLIEEAYYHILLDKHIVDLYFLSLNLWMVACNHRQENWLSFIQAHFNPKRLIF